MQTRKPRLSVKEVTLAKNRLELKQREERRAENVKEYQESPKFRKEVDELLNKALFHKETVIPSNEVLARIITPAKYPTSHHGIARDPFERSLRAKLSVKVRDMTPEQLREYRRQKVVEKAAREGRIIIQPKARDPNRIKLKDMTREQYNAYDRQKAAERAAREGRIVKPQVRLPVRIKDMTSEQLREYQRQKHLERAAREGRIVRDPNRLKLKDMTREQYNAYHRQKKVARGGGTNREYQRRRRRAKGILPRKYLPVKLKDMTPEQLREYKSKQNLKYRRAKGIPPKQYLPVRVKDMTPEQVKEYGRKRLLKYRRAKGVLPRKILPVKVKDMTREQRRAYEREGYWLRKTKKAGKTIEQLKQEKEVNELIHQTMPKSFFVKLSREKAHKKVYVRKWRQNRKLAKVISVKTE